MKVVANSSVLIGLCTIGQLGLLQKKWEEIIIPRAVWKEVVEEGTGQPGAREVASASWIKIEDIKDRAMAKLLQAELDDGEAEALALAQEIGADIVLLDEKDARQAAERLDLRVLGTVGILIWAKRKGHIKSLREQLDNLQEKAKFRISSQVYEESLQVVREI